MRLRRAGPPALPWWLVAKPWCTRRTRASAACSFTATKRMPAHGAREGGFLGAGAARHPAAGGVGLSPAPLPTPRTRRGAREQLLRSEGELMDPMPHLYFLRRVCAPDSTARTKQLLAEQQAETAERRAADRDARREAAAERRNRAEDAAEQGLEEESAAADAVQTDQLSVLPVLTVEDGPDTRPASLDIHLRGPGEGLQLVFAGMPVAGFW